MKQTAREELIDKLEERMWQDRDIGAMIDSVAEFIVEDRKRIVEPLVPYLKDNHDSWATECMKEACKLAGIE